MSKVKRMFWDIETSPNIAFTWKCGWKVSVNHWNIIHERAIICICWKWEDQKGVFSLTWDEGDDKEMLAKFSEEVEKADEMVAHNGDKFDMRWFNGRCLIHELSPPPKPKLVDTWKMTKRNFNLNSGRLDYLGHLLLGEGKIDTGGFDLWRRICLNNDQAALRKMVKYCKHDVVLLERIWQKLRDYEAAATHAAVNVSGDPMHRWKCQHCGSDHVHTNKTRITAKGMTQFNMKCNECGRYYTIANNVHNWYLAAKRDEDEQDS